jgi:hypothetical protein
MNPYAMTTVAHFRLMLIVRRHITTTPPATRRADTSLTGLGNEKSDAALLEVPEVVPEWLTITLPTSR